MQSFLYSILKDESLEFAYETALRYYFSLHYRSVPEGPRNVISERLLSEVLGRTPRPRRIIYVTGTNGKGSVAMFITQALGAVGQKTITLISPHVNTVRERILINGTPISKRAFTLTLSRTSQAIEQVRATKYQPNPPGLAMIVGMYLHQRLGEQYWGVYEVGRGGYTDYSNVLAPQIVVLTRVASDHVAEYGSHKALALDKIQLAKTGCLVVSAPQNRRVEVLLKDYCVAHDVNLKWARHDIENSHVRGDVAYWQKDNLALALSTLESIGCEPPLGAISLPPLPARLEVRTLAQKKYILDSAHNVPGVLGLLRALSARGSTSSLELVAGFSESKDWKRMIRALSHSGIFSRVLTTQGSRGHQVDPNITAAEFDSYGCLEVVATAGLPEALNMTRHTTSKCVVIGLLVAADYDRALHLLGLGEYAISNKEIDPVQPWMQWPWHPKTK